jgi:brefeldin A-inhibited guanine nucleotide-exchange protein
MLGAEDSNAAKAVGEVLKQSFGKLLKHVRKNIELKQACAEALQSLDELGGDVPDADNFFHPFKLACDSDDPKLASIALETMQYLTNYGFLSGRGPDPFHPAETDRCLMDSVVEAICSITNSGDENVELLMLRALLTAVHVPNSAVHLKSLMLTLKTCFTLHRISRHTTSQRSAQVTLTQMLNVIIQRMELSAASGSQFMEDDYNGSCSLNKTISKSNYLFQIIIEYCEFAN